MTTTNIFIALSGLSTLIAFIPLAWHVRNRNTSAVCLIVWITLFNFLSFINAIIWGGPDMDIFTAWDGKVFCDIEIKIFIASGAGIVTSIAAIARNLAKIMSDKISVVKTKRVRRRELIQDLCICLGLPVWTVAMHYLVQPNRYYLLATGGCTPTIDNSWPSIPLILVWPPVISLVSAYYAGLVLVRIHRYRRQFSDILRSSNSNLTTSRFVRLFVLALILEVVNLPLTFYVFYRNLIQPRVSYDWNLVHDKRVWDIIVRIPTYDVIQFDRWISVGAGFILFLIFGTGGDALKMYRGWLETTGLAQCLPDRIMGSNTIGSTQYTSEKGTSSLGSFISKRWASRRQLIGGSTSGSRSETINTTSSTEPPAMTTTGSQTIDIEANPRTFVWPLSSGRLDFVRAYPERVTYNNQGILIDKDVVVENRRATIS